MTERSNDQPETAFASWKLQRLFADLQAIVDRNVRQTGLSANVMTHAERMRLANRTSMYVEFEVNSSDILVQGMPLVFEGAGGFMITDRTYQTLAPRDMAEGDTLSGSVDRCYVFAVPSLRSMLDSASFSHVGLDDLSISAAVILDRARYKANGRRSMAYDFYEHNQIVIVPLVYGMAARIGTAWQESSQ